MPKTTPEIEERNKKLGKLLQKYRKDQRITQEEMANFCNLTKNHLSKIEQGVYKCPAYVLIDYAKRLNISLDILTGNTEESRAAQYTAANIIPELQAKLGQMSRKDQRTLLVVLDALENSEKLYAELYKK